MAQNCLPDGSDAPPPAGVSTLEWHATLDRNSQELDDSMLARALQDMHDDDCKLIIRLEQRASEEGAGSREDIDEHGCNSHLSLTHTNSPGVSISPRDKLGGPLEVSENQFSVFREDEDDPTPDDDEFEADAGAPVAGGKRKAEGDEDCSHNSQRHHGSTENISSAQCSLGLALATPVLSPFLQPNSARQGTTALKISPSGTSSFTAQPTSAALNSLNFIGPLASCNPSRPSPPSSSSSSAKPDARVCPCCGEVHSLKNTIGRAAMALAICAAKVFETQLVICNNSPVRVCRKCYESSRSALSTAREVYPTAEDFGNVQGAFYGRGKKAVFIDAVFRCGNETMADVFKAVADGSTPVRLENIGKVVAKFKVGDIVDVARRKQPGMNKEGGVARVASVGQAGDAVVYSVKYVVAGHGESNLREAELELHEEVTQPRSDACSAATTARDTERTMDRLSGELDRARARIGVLEAEASRQRERYRALGMKRKEAVREAKRLESELRDLLVLREAENERTHRGILELVDEAVAAATADATASIKYRVLEAKKVQEKTRREHSARVKELERQLSLAHVNQQRIECSVAEMLKETAEEVAAQAEAATAEVKACAQAEVAAAESRMRQVEDKAMERRDVSSLLSAAQALGVETTDRRLSHSTGAKSSCAAELGDKDRNVLAKTAVKCISKVIEAAAPAADVAGFAALVSQRKDFRDVFPLFEGTPSTEIEALKGLQRNVAQGYRIYKQQKNRPMSKALLSLIAGTDTIANVRLAMTHRVAIATGKLVAVHQKGHSTIEGVVTSIDSEKGTCIVDVYERSEEMKRRRWTTTAEEADLVFAGMTRTGTVMPDVRLSEVSVVGSVRCTEHDAKAARALASEHFPGKVLMKELLVFHRVRKSVEHERAMAAHYDDEELFPLRFSSSKGAIYFRSLSIRDSYQRACTACRSIGCEVPRWEDYLNVLSSSDYTRQVPLNCVCSYCRVLGLETFDELVELIGYINLPKDVEEEYVERAKWVRKYLSVDYAGNLKEESSNVWHCMKFALTTANFGAFADPCSHGCDGSGHIRAQEPNMDDLARKPVDEGGRGENATADCWDGECFRCAKNGGAEVILCNNCATVGCKDCIQRTRDDIAIDITKRPVVGATGAVGSVSGGGGASARRGRDGRGGGRVGRGSGGRRTSPPPMCPTGWRCDECQAEDSQRDHHSSDAAMNEVVNFLRELKNAIMVNGIEDGHVTNLPAPDGESDEDDSDYEIREDEQGSSEEEVETEDDGGGAGSEEEDEEEGERERSSGEEGKDGIVEDGGGEGGGAPVRRLRPRITEEQRRRDEATNGVLARLRHIVRNLELLRGHKVRTVKFRQLRKDQLKDLDNCTVMEWKDYMGKLEARKSKQGTSENLGRKLSLHGSLFILRNPPQSIREQHPEVDYSKFPAADDDCLVQVNMYGASDESKQSAFHMGNVMSVQYKAVKAAFPWLTSAIPYSDQCGDYRSTAATVFNHEMGRLTGLSVKLVLHSEVGEGKGEVDMRFGQKSQQFVAILGRLSRTCAAELFDHLELCRGDGDYSIELGISLALFREGSSGAIPYLEQCSAVEYTDGGGLLMREVHGYGPGIEVTAEQLKELDHYGLMGVEETGSHAIQTTEEGMVPQRRAHDDSKRQAAGERQQKRKDAENKQEHSKRHKLALLAAVEPVSSARRCAGCKASYRNERSFQKHFSNGKCDQRRNAASQRAQRKPATALVAERRAKQRAASAAAAVTHATRVYGFSSSEDGRAISFTEVDGGGTVVKSVLANRKRLATLVLPTYRVEAVTDNGTALEDWTAEELAALLEQSGASRVFKVTFSKPAANMPMRGYARKRTHKESKTKLMKVQVDFMSAFCDTHEEARSQPRAKTVHDAMKARFGDMALDADTGRPILLGETAIFNWLKSRWAAKKVALTHIAAAAAIGAVENEAE